MSEQVKSRRKLIEVALPLEAINEASAREKSIRHGHPSTLHLWWARRPLAAARAVIFAQMVDDPSANPDLFPTEKAQEKERKRLFKVIEELVKWENTNNDQILQAARDEIWQSWRRACADNAGHPRAKELFDRHKLPAFHDPFAGGGALPLEAQRLGLEAYASDLNPVAVLINKAMIEIPPKFAGKPPVNPEAQRQAKQMGKAWHGAQGLAEDVRYYGQWMRDEAQKRIGGFYPDVEITPETAKERPELKRYIGRRLTVVAWIWARTVKSPNPAFSKVDVPLVSTFELSSKSGREAYVEPLIKDGTYRFVVRTGKPKDLAAIKDGTKLSRGANFKCLMSDTPMSGSHIKSEGIAGRMGAKLMAVIVEGDRERLYVSPTEQMEDVASKAAPTWKPELSLPNDPRNFWTVQYGLATYADLFTHRQLLALNTFSDLISHVRERVKSDGLKAGGSESTISLYADAVATYAGFAVDYAANYWSTIATPADGFIRGTFARQSLPMTWDFAEAPPFGNTSGNWLGGIEWISKALECFPSAGKGFAAQADAATQSLSQDKIVSTDPPYYDNITYAELSDFFYVWLRRALKPLLPELFSTMAVPKEEELVATPYRHGSKDKAEEFFLSGMANAMHRLAEQAHAGFPITIYYAFKQAESSSNDGVASTGWETFLGAVIRAGFSVTGTWPMRTERGARSISIGTNALASSIILVCHPRAASAQPATRRDFISALKGELPAALAHLQRSNIAPVDLAQAAIGPGMAVYTRYSKVLDASGQPLSVRDALALINQTLDEVQAEQEGDLDADTRWALAWFEQSGFAAGEFGVAETLSKAKNTSVEGLKRAGILDRKTPPGKVRLLKPSELDADWDPDSAGRLSAWEVVHHLIRALEKSGEGAASDLVKKLGSKAEMARELAYRLYTICERKKRSQEALSYNALVQSWPEIIRLSQSLAPRAAQQSAMFAPE